MELSEHQQEFAYLGIRVAAITYESPDMHLKFTKKHDIGYPLLSDLNARYVLAFGILNDSYEPGHRAYGIPHPGIFLLDSTGIVRAKFSEERYQDRPSIDRVLKAAKEMNMIEVLQ